jgi:cytochrome P450
MTTNYGHSSIASEAASADAEAAAVFNDLFSPQGRAEPYSRYARLREIAPVLRLDATTAPSNFLAGTTVLTRYNDCDQVLRDTAAFHALDPAWMDTKDPNWHEHPSISVIGQSMLGHNPPEHTRLRNLVKRPFTAQRVLDLTERISELISAQLDAMADAGADGSTIDLYEIFAMPLPIAVIGTLLGIPESDIPWLRPHAADLAFALDLFSTDKMIADADAAQREITPYLQDLASQRREDPRNDLMTALVAARDGSSGSNDGLTDEELASTASVLFLGGYETTLNLITNAVVTLMHHPDQARQLRENPAMAAGCIEEVLRYDAPAQATSRYAVADISLSEVQIPAGTEVLTMIGAANRDPARFSDPDHFNLDRNEAKALSFGAGPHFCLGAPLARLEAGLALPALLQRFPNLALAAEPTRGSSFTLRGYTTVPVVIR